MGLVALLFAITGRDTLPGPVLRRLLEDLGLTPDGTRALLSRMRRQGQLAGDRRGREVEYRLVGEFAASFRRARDQSTTRPTRWPGHFHAVLYQVPERDRSFRDALRREAILTGYGLLQPGVLIAPTDRSAGLADLLHHSPSRAQVWLSTLAMEAEPATRAASMAWDLPGLAQTYHHHIERLNHAATPHTVTGNNDPTGSPQRPRPLLAYVETLLPALIDTLREPRLPPDLMPRHWPGAELRLAMDRFSQTHAGTTDHYLAGRLWSERLRHG